MPKQTKASETAFTPPASSPPALRDQSNYAEIPTITDYIVPRKQAAKRHYGPHQYFTRRPWNVVQAYIERYSRLGDVVCDTYGGTGVTIIEAMAVGRRGIYFDISRWATFLAAQIAVAPINLGSLAEAFQQVESACASKINAWWKLSADEVECVPLARWYPRNAPLPTNGWWPREPSRVSRGR